MPSQRGVAIRNRNDRDHWQGWVRRMHLYHYPLGLPSRITGFRAWALQERVLPPRVLSLGLAELFWDCIQVPNASESLPYGHMNLPTRFYLTVKAIPNTSDNEILEDVWWHILEEYTDRELTYPKVDKLVALSGIATRMGIAMDDVYVAGHFWKTLPYSLNWQVQPPLAHEKRRKRMARRITQSANEDNGERQNKTPSWSWASMDGPLFILQFAYLTRRNKSLADAEAYALTPVDETNPAGQIVSASLNIRAYCAEIEWTQGRPVLLS
jgi:hypothetical protein